MTDILDPTKVVPFTADSAEVHPAPQRSSGNGVPPIVVPGESVSDEYAGMDIIDSSTDAEGIDAPKRLTAAMLNKFAQDNPSIYPLRRYKLHQTSIQLGEPVYATIRIVNLTDRALVGTLPTEVRKLIEQLFFAGGSTSNQRKQKTSSQRMDEGLGRIKQIGYAYGIAAFVEPKLVLRPEEVKDPETEAWVGSIALHDLTELSRICEGDDALAARRLEGFPDEPDSAL